MSNHEPFRCFLIGADTLLLECGQILLDGGHQVAGVITGEERIAAWAKERELPVLHPKQDDLVARLGDEPYDYLFAITHLAILPDEVVATAQKMAINFHDGPLPAYAGLNTPAWALVNKEARYGITWHQITSGVDEGGILKQAIFDLAPSETSVSLNTRNFAVAMETFTELVKDLEKGEATPRPQEGERSYFGRHDRPTAASLLDFTRPAADLEAIVRALDFGAYANPVGSATLCVGDEAVIVTSAQAVELENSAPAGQVVSADGETLTVACQDGGLAMSAFRSLRGHELSAGAVAERLGLSAGQPLPGAPEGLRAALGERSESLSKAESFWARRLRRLEPVELPWAGRPAGAEAGAARVLDVDVPDDFKEAHGDQLDDALAAAAVAWLGRVAAKEHFSVAQAKAEHGFAPLLAREVPLDVEVDLKAPFGPLLERWTAEREKAAKRDTFLESLIARTPELAGKIGDDEVLLPVAVDVGEAKDAPLPPGSVLALRSVGGGLSLVWDESRLGQDDAARIAGQLSALLGGLAAYPDAPVGRINLLSEEERKALLETWNDTAVEVAPATVHELFCRVADERPDEVAVRFQGQALTYQELDERANHLARLLQDKGAGPDKLVGVHVERSAEMMVAVLGTLKAGAAYVPLDPTYPEDRVHMMIEDAGLTATITRGSDKARLPDGAPSVIDIDEVQGRSAERPEAKSTPESLAYVIYTSGSTGKPKGVMVEHRNVVNFFAGMDACVPHDPPGKWLAVTSLSFDISVLELLYTLTRGFEVLVYKDDQRARAIKPRSGRPMDFGLFYWGNDDGEGREKYRLLLEGAKFADEHGFESIWTPERHFHAFGGPYPNPAVTGAAVAAVTKRLSVRSGSCVLPLHHPARVAEEWAVVDNLSGGRAALSLAAGWQPDDFLLRPESYPGNKQVMFDNIDVLRKLWRGEPTTFPGPNGDVDVVTQPRPVQKELPIWITTAGNPKTYEQAASVKGNVLTHLLGQSVDEVGEKVKIYRDALEAHGYDRHEGKVTLMLHTFVGEDTEKVKEIVREPMKDYLRSSVSLVKSYAWAFPAFKRPEGAKSPLDVDLTSLDEEELEAILDFAFERYFEDSGLFGDLDACLEQIERLKAIEVDEIACLIDFGVPTQQVLDMLPALDKVRAAANEVPTDEDGEPVGDYSLPGLIAELGVTHMQCTPSMARMLSTDTDTRLAMAQVKHLFVGGEAFPVDLARDLKKATTGTVRNMYGPTETTIWSSTEPVEDGIEQLPIGRPIANTQLYVLNEALEPQPVGVPGDLYIGGDGVVRGYLHRPELTAERFVADPFRGDGARMYKTGDVARFLPDGRVDFLGRADHQVKIRGYRVELGEIEARLGEHPAVQVCVTLVREDTPGDQRLVAYVVPAKSGAGKGFDEGALRAHLKEHLPEYMVPQHFVKLGALPQTPNKKIDRKALPAPSEVKEEAPGEMVAPTNELEQKIAQAWCSVLGRNEVGVDSNFFDLGGHSLLVVRLNRELREVLDAPPSLTDLYRFPTIRSFVESLQSGGVSEQVKQSADRGARRRDALKRRRRGRVG